MDATRLVEAHVCVLEYNARMNQWDCAGCTFGITDEDMERRAAKSVELRG